MRGMNFTNVTSPDWTSAWEHWHLALATAGWHPWAVAALQVTVAGLCFAVARQAVQARVWRRSALLLLLLSVSTLFALDVLAVELARVAARQAGWYGARRTLQMAVLGALALAAVWAISAAALEAPKPRRAALRTWPGAVPFAPVNERWVEFGMALLLTLALLRFVSLHATDAWLGLRWAGLSLGRVLEGVGLGLVGLRAAWLLHLGRA